MPKTTRRRRTKAAIQKILSDFQSSGLSQERFCKENQIPYSSFQSWLKKSRKTNQSVLPAIIPVGIVPSPAPWIEVELPQGQVIRLSPGVNSEDLKTVLTALRQC